MRGRRVREEKRANPLESSRMLFPRAIHPRGRAGTGSEPDTRRRRRGRRLLREYWSRAQQHGTRDGDSLTDAEESKAQHHAAISQPTTPTQAVGWDGRKPSLWWRPGVPDPWDHRPLGIAAPPLDDLVSCRHAEGACWLVGLLVGLLVGWMDGLRHAGCGSRAGLLQVPSRHGPDPDPRYRSRQ